MGSRPWKETLRNRLSPDYEGEVLRVETGHEPPEVTEARFTGFSRRGSTWFLDFNSAPPEMLPSDGGYWDYESHVSMERGLKVYYEGKLIAEAPELTRRMRGR